MSCIKVPGLQNDLPPPTMEISGDLTDVLTKNKELIKLANKVYGNSWSHSVTNTTIDFIDSNSGKYYVGCQATVKVQLSNGIYHEDVGYSSVDASTKGLAFEKARLISVTNALKKVLSCFTEMEAEMRQFTSSQNSVANISSITKTMFVKRPLTPPPPAQSTPKITKSPATLEKIQRKKVPISAASNNELKAPESNSKMETDTNVEELDIIFESSVNFPTLNAPTPSNSTASTSTLTEEEIRLERKRKQREKQEEYKRQMKEKEEREKQNPRQDVQKPNPKF